MTTPSVPVQKRGLAPPPEISLSSGNATILVVDDDPDILEALAEILESEGYGIRRARNGQEALDQLHQGTPSLILLDLMMPVMDGWEFSRRMKQFEPPPKVPIIVLSADRNVAAKARDIGAVGHLAKPFELADLLEMVRKALSSAALA